MFSILWDILLDGTLRKFFIAVLIIMVSLVYMSKTLSRIVREHTRVPINGMVDNTCYAFKEANIETRATNDELNRTLSNLNDTLSNVDDIASSVNDALRNSQNANGIALLLSYLKHNVKGHYQKWKGGRRGKTQMKARKQKSESCLDNGYESFDE